MASFFDPLVNTILQGLNQTILSDLWTVEVRDQTLDGEVSS